MRQFNVFLFSVNLIAAGIASLPDYASVSINSSATDAMAEANISGQRVSLGFSFNGGGAGFDPVSCWLCKIYQSISVLFL